MPPRTRDSRTSRSSPVPPEFASTLGYPWSLLTDSRSGRLPSWMRPRRQPSESEICALQDFGALISRELKGTSSASAALHNAVLPVVGHGGGAWSILSAIVQSAEDAIVSTDLSGVILSWNPGAERLCGYSAAEMLGRSIFLTVPPERLEEARDMIAKAEQGQPNLRRETVRIHKDGTRRFVSLSISAIKDADG